MPGMQDGITPLIDISMKHHLTRAKFMAYCKLIIDEVLLYIDTIIDAAQTGIWTNA